MNISKHGIMSESGELISCNCGNEQDKGKNAGTRSTPAEKTGPKLVKEKDIVVWKKGRDRLMNVTVVKYSLSD